MEKNFTIVKVNTKNRIAGLTFINCAVFLFILTLSNCCPCYFSKSAETTSEIKTQFDNLIVKAVESYSMHENEIKDLGNTIDKAIAKNNQRNGCKPQSTRWSDIKASDGTGAYDEIVTTWKKDNVLAQTTIDGLKKRMDLLLDAVTEGEEEIKKHGKKPCD